MITSLSWLYDGLRTLICADVALKAHGTHVTFRITSHFNHQLTSGFVVTPFPVLKYIKFYQNTKKSCQGLNYICNSIARFELKGPA